MRTSDVLEIIIVSGVLALSGLGGCALFATVSIVVVSVSVAIRVIHAVPQ